MDAAQIIKRCVWLINTVYNHGPISFKELHRRYEEDFERGSWMEERMFHRYRGIVSTVFDVDIEYNRTLKGYVINNRSGIENMKLREWMIRTFSICSELHQNQDLKKRILLGDSPSEMWFPQVVNAMRENLVLKMSYKAFYEAEASTFEVEPWFVKNFNGRWYVIGKIHQTESDQLFRYALDRVEALEPTDCKFKYPKKYDPEQYFENYYGIMADDEEFGVETVVLRVDADQCDYLRTRKLHHTQVEVERTAGYSVFKYNLCPAYDFRQKILSMGDTVEVLAPSSLRKHVGDVVRFMYEKYSRDEDGKPVMG